LKNLAQFFSIRGVIIFKPKLFNNMKINHLLMAAAGFAALLTACDPTPNRKDTKETTEETNENKIEATTSSDSSADAREDDAGWVAEAASGGMMEVQAAELAIKKAVSPQVKEFAKMMIEDHKKANDELKTLATAKNITLPTALMDKHQKVINDIQDKTGKDFDITFMNRMLDDHKEDVEKFQKAADKANDAEVKAFATKTLPTLIKHREMAEKVEKMTDKM
jgi:putative membrane protein